MLATLKKAYDLIVGLFYIYLFSCFIGDLWYQAVESWNDRKARKAENKE